MLFSSVAVKSSLASAQTIRGVVLEAAGRTALAGVIIQIQSTRQPVAAVTDSLGQFSLTLPRDGVYTLRTSHPAYNPHSDSVRVGPGESVSIEIRMELAAIPLQPLVVTARSRGWLTDFEARRKAGGFGRYLTRKDVEARGASRASDLLRVMPGILVTQQRRGNTALVQMRGTGGPCQPSVWIDGLYIAQAPGGTTLDDVLSPATVDGVEIYNTVSAAPIQYRTGSCGVLLFWTRRGSVEDGGKLRWKKAAVSIGAIVAFILLVR